MSNNLPKCKQTATNESIWASSNSSKLFSHVGCKKDKLKAFARRGHIALSMTSKLKTCHHNSACYIKINCIITIICIMQLIKIIVEMNYPNGDDAFATQYLRPDLKISTGWQYFSWGSGLPFTRRKLAMKSCRLPSYCTAKGKGLSSTVNTPCRWSWVLRVFKT